MLFSPKDEKHLLWALKDVSFEVRQGEMFGLVGKNGAGKSVLLKIISRLTTPTTGSIRLRGRVGSLLEVGTGFHQDLTGRENIFMNGTILGMTKSDIRNKFDEIVEFSGVERFMDTPLKKYSSGMKVRLGFAVAAHLEPEILIVDEVLAVGDAEFQKKCLTKLDEIKQAGRTILFVSHNLTAVRDHCSRGIFLDKGKLILEGSMEEVIDRYLDSRDAVPQTGVVLDKRKGKSKAEAVSIERVVVLNQKGEIKSQLMHRQPFQILIQFTSEKEIKDVLINIQFSLLDNTLVGLADSYSMTGNLSAFSRGSHEVIFEVSQQFMPLGYFLNVSIQKQDGSMLDAVERVFDFHINKVGISEGLNFKWLHPVGVVETAGNWRL